MTASTRRPASRSTSLLSAVVLALLALLTPVAGPAAPPPTMAADTDVTLVTDALYEVRPDERVVHVTVRIVARNHRAETRTRKFYADRAYLAVLPGTGGFHVAGAPGAKVHVAKKTAKYTLLRIDFGTRLYGGTSRAYTLEFDLQDAAAKAGSQVRIGGSLASFPVWAFASDGAKGSTVAVVFPAGYDVHVETGAFDRTAATEDGGTRLETHAIAAPTTWFAYVIGEREATFTETPLTIPVGDSPIALTLRAWDDDPVWAERVGGLFGRALPLMTADIGIPWPHADATIVQEAVTRSSGGYAGLYDPTESRIEVAYWAGDLVVLHEAAHGWFNGSLLADRWANEGFASLYAERAAVALEVTGTSPDLTEEVAAARIPLNAWAARAEEGDPESEAYGYAGSLALARLIAERAGDETLRLVWADAAAADDVPDWRTLLDLLEARTETDFTDLWRAWVVRDDQLPLLDARADARLSRERTLALADGWTLPAGVGDALRAWQFDIAEQLLADARTVLAQRTAVETRAARSGLTPPGTMRELFEAGDMLEASRAAEAELNALLALEGAVAERHDDPDVLTRIGMLGVDPEADLERARAAFEAGDLDSMHAASDAAFTAWSEAWQEGRRRALFAVAVTATALVLASAVVAGIRRARRPGPGGTGVEAPTGTTAT